MTVRPAASAGALYDFRLVLREEAGDRGPIGGSAVGINELRPSINPMCIPGEKIPSQRTGRSP